MTLAKRWLKACESHPGCSGHTKNTNLEMPTHLLDLASPGLGEGLVLCEAVQAAELYATLSHRWGATPLTTIKTLDLQNRLWRICLASLPRTFREAVIFTRRTRIRYLWMDSLCIIQDSEEDQNREIPRMAAIFSNRQYMMFKTDGSS